MDALWGYCRNAMSSRRPEESQSVLHPPRKRPRAKDGEEEEEEEKQAQPKAEEHQPLPPMALVQDQHRVPPSLLERVPSWKAWTRSPATHWGVPFTLRKVVVPAYRAAALSLAHPFPEALLAFLPAGGKPSEQADRIAAIVAYTRACEYRAPDQAPPAHIWMPPVPTFAEAEDASAPALPFTEDPEKAPWRRCKRLRCTDGDAWVSAEGAQTWAVLWSQLPRHWAAMLDQGGPDFVIKDAALMPPEEWNFVLFRLNLHRDAWAKWIRYGTVLCGLLYPETLVRLRWSTPDVLRVTKEGIHPCMGWAPGQLDATLVCWLHQHPVFEAEATRVVWDMPTPHWTALMRAPALSMAGTLGWLQSLAFGAKTLAEAVALARALACDPPALRASDPVARLLHRTWSDIPLDRPEVRGSLLVWWLRLRVAAHTEPRLHKSLAVVLETTLQSREEHPILSLAVRRLAHAWNKGQHAVCHALGRVQQRRAQQAARQILAASTPRE